jgi:hypothetical protein
MHRFASTSAVVASACIWQRDATYASSSSTGRRHFGPEERGRMRRNNSNEHSFHVFILFFPFYMIATFLCSMFGNLGSTICYSFMNNCDENASFF